MRLIRYEWRKLWKDFSVLKIVLFFILISSLIFWGEMKKNEEWTSEYLKMHTAVDNGKQKDANAWLAEEKTKQENPEGNMSDFGTKKALECIGQEMEALENYDAYRESIQNRYEKNQSISIFSDSDGNQERYMRKIARTYEELQVEAPMKLQPYQGIQGLLNFYAGDILAVVFLIYVVSVVFLQEDKAGKTEFAQTTLHGGGLMFGAKVLTAYGSMALYILITFFVNLMLETAVFGAISFSAAIQSIPDLFAVPYAWTIGQYIGMYLCLKMAAAFLITAAAVALAKWTASEALTAAGLAGFVGMSIWAGSFLSGDGGQAVLRLWNVWSMLRGKAMIGNYELIRLGSVVLAAGWGILLILVLGMGLLFFAGKSQRKERMRNPKIKRKKKEIPHTIFYYEAKKMWIHQGGLLFFTACILIQGMTVWQYHSNFGADEYYYQRYIDQFGGRVTGQTDETISQEEKRLQEAEQRLRQETDGMRANVLQQELECRGGFQQYVNRVDALRQDGKEEILLKDTQYNILFEFTEVSRIMVVLLCASFAFLIPRVFQKEKETRAEILQKTAKHGGRRLWTAKIGTILLYIIPLVIVFAAFSFGKASMDYKLKLQAPLNCLAIFWDSKLQWTVAGGFFMGILIQCVVAATAAVVLSACAKRVENQYMMTGMILAGSVIPTLLSPYLPIQWLRWIHDFFYVFTGRGYLLIVPGLIAILAAGIMRKERKV